MTGVIVKSNETFEKALKRFSKACEKSGILSDLRKNQYYEKPSEKRKREISQAKRKAMKDRLIEAGIIKPRVSRFGRDRDRDRDDR
jgi:small subunit ribosomal protein S21